MGWQGHVQCGALDAGVRTAAGGAATKCRQSPFAKSMLVFIPSRRVFLLACWRYRPERLPESSGFEVQSGKRRCRHHARAAATQGHASEEKDGLGEGAAVGAADGAAGSVQGLEMLLGRDFLEDVDEGLQGDGA